MSNRVTLTLTHTHTHLHYMHTHTHLHHTHTHTHTHIYIFIHTHTHTYIYIPLYTHTQRYIHLYTHMHVRVRIYTAFHIIRQIVFKGHKHSFFVFSIKLMDGIVSQGSLDDNNIIIKLYLYSTFHAKECSSKCFTANTRSEEHTSELQSHLNLVCRRVLAKAKTR